MNDAKRLFEGDANAFEKALLDYGRSEAVPEHLVRQMELGLGLAAPVIPVALTPEAGGLLKAGFVGKAWLAGAVALGLTTGTYLVQLAATTQPVPHQTELVGAEVNTSKAETETLKGNSAALNSAALSRAEPGQADLQQGAQRPAPPVTPDNQASSEKPTTRLPKSGLNARARSAPALDTKQLQTRLELQLLDPARAAIVRGDYQQAARLLSDYERRFPSGILKREAGVLRGSLANRNVRDAR